MSLELKNIKYSGFASEETHCYQANLYFKGKKVATVRNDGHGGPDYQDFTSKEAEKAVYDWLWGMGGEWPDNCDKYGESAALEFWCSYRVNDFLLKKEMKKSMSKRILYTIKGEEGVYQTKTAGNAKQRDAWAHQVDGWETTDKVLNLLPDSEALAIFREATQ